MRWLILDLAEAVDVTDPVLDAPRRGAGRAAGAQGRADRRGRASRRVAQRLGAYDVAHRPAVAANVDQAVMILKMLRPKTDIRRPPQRAKQRISSLTLPRIEPPIGR